MRHRSPPQAASILHEQEQRLEEEDDDRRPSSSADDDGSAAGRGGVGFGSGLERRTSMAQRASHGKLAFAGLPKRQESHSTGLGSHGGAGLVVRGLLPHQHGGDDHPHAPPRQESAHHPASAYHPPQARPPPPPDRTSQSWALCARVGDIEPSLSEPSAAATSLFPSLSGWDHRADGAAAPPPAPPAVSATMASLAATIMGGGDGDTSGSGLLAAIMAAAATAAAASAATDQKLERLIDAVERLADVQSIHHSAIDDLQHGVKKLHSLT